jgi:hypothetical protein
MDSMLRVKGWLKSLNQLFEVDDHRRRLRLKADFHATISGAFGTLDVIAVDANRNGAGVMASSPLPKGTLVYLQIADLGAMGFAHVRHCSECNGRYLLGLRFREPLSRDRTRGDNWTRERITLTNYDIWDGKDV